MKVTRIFEPANSSDDFLTLEECRRTRTCDKFLRWKSDVCERANESPGRKAWLLSGRRPYKQFCEEIHLFSIFASITQEINQYNITFPLDDDNIDTVLDNMSGVSRIYIEFSNAAWDRNTARRLRLASTTPTPGSGEISKRNLTDGRYALETGFAPQLYSDAERSLQVATKLRDILDKKMRTSYPAPSWLLLGFSVMGIDEAELLNCISSELEPIATKSAFERIYSIASERCWKRLK